MRSVILMSVIGLLVGLAGCDSSEPAAGDTNQPIVFVSVPPQAHWARRIAGEHVDVRILVPPGQSPHNYEPTPRQMVSLSNARAFFRVGVPFEDALLERLAEMEQLKIIDTRDGLELIAMVEHDHGDEDHAAHHDHDHADHADHDHAAHDDHNHHDHAAHDDHDHHDHAAHDDHDHHAGELDPHIWMSPALAKHQARLIFETLVALVPEHSIEMEKNLDALDADLDAVSNEIALALAPVRGRTFYVFHPAFGYFAQQFGLKQQAVETGGKAPGPRHVKQLIDQAKADGVRVIFVQPQFSDQAARTIARQIDGVVVPIDPLSEDYLTNLRQLAEQLRAALLSPAESEVGP